MSGGAAAAFELFEGESRLLNPKEESDFALVGRGGRWVCVAGWAARGRVVSGPDPEIDGLASTGVEVKRVPGPRDDLQPFQSGFQRVLPGIDEKGQIFSIQEVSKLFAVELDVDTTNSPKGIVSEDVNEGVLGVRRRERFEGGPTGHGGGAGCKEKEAQADKYEMGQLCFASHGFSLGGGRFEARLRCMGSKSSATSAPRGFAMLLIRSKSDETHAK